MCGRYYFDPERDDPLTQKLSQALYSIGEEPFRGGEIFPGTKIPALFPSTKDQSVQLAFFFWGFDVPYAKQNIINARSETVDSKVTFKDAFEKARILVPAHAYYEWDKNKERHLYAIPNHELFFLTAIARPEDKGRSLVLLTCEAEGVQREVHHRMPLCLTQEDAQKWLRDDAWALNLTQKKAENIPYEIALN